MRILSPDTEKEHRYVVDPKDVAAFQGNTVHHVCSTFALAREIEWTTRLFVLEMIDDEEEGVGSHLSIEHKSPAFIGEEIVFKARIERLVGHELICTYQASVGARVIATGTTGQKILKKEKINLIFKVQ